MSVLVTRSSMPSLEEYANEIASLWDTHWLTNFGEKHEKLTAMLEDYLKVPYVSLMVNGHLAIELTIQAMGLTGEVITTPFTFASTTHALVRNGLTPVFCDIDPDDHTIDVSMIEDLITDKTSAIMPVHVYGNICDVEAIEDIAERHGLKVIYDAAHTFGETYKGKGVACFGDASCFSFHATKVFNTIEGGAVCFADESLRSKLHYLKDFGILDEETVVYSGANAKMNEFSAAMGICNLRHIEEEIEKRRIVTEHYRDRLKDIPGIRLNPVNKDVKSNYAYFPVVVEDEYGADRNELHKKLASEDIFSRKYFYPLTSLFDCYKDRFDAGRTPVALDTSRRVLTLPMYADLPLEDVDRICDITGSFRKGS